MATAWAGAILPPLMAVRSTDSGRRSGKRSARDNMNNEKKRQPGAMDSAIRQLNQQQGFDKRWSHLTGKIQVWG